MKIKRLFTMEGEGPYKSLEFETRTSVIRNPDGSVVSEWENVTVPKHWSQVATDIMAQKYFRKAGIPEQLKPAKEKGIPSWLQPSLPDLVVSDQEKNETEYTITAIIHDVNKYAQVEDTTIATQPRNITTLLDVKPAPSNLTAIENIVELDNRAVAKIFAPRQS